MVILKYENFRNQVKKLTLANARGGRSLNIEINLNTLQGEFVINEKKKNLLTTKDLKEAINRFNELEESGPGQNTKVKTEILITPAKEEKDTK